MVLVGLAMDDCDETSDEGKNSEYQNSHINAYRANEMPVKNYIKFATKQEKAESHYKCLRSEV